MDPFSNLAPPPSQPPSQAYLPFLMSPPPTTVVPNHVAPPAAVNPQNPNHPSYTEMIYAAITALKEQDGSSKRAIAKYIERIFTDLPATHSSLLTHHLKRLKDNGSLVMVKKSYKLPRSDDIPISDNNSNVAVTEDASGFGIPPSTGVPKKDRGRPPKPKFTDSVTGPVNSQLIMPGPVNSQLIMPGPVVNSQPLNSVIPGPGNVGVPVVVKRGRGRPPQTGSVLGKRGRGRPPGRPRKPKSISSQNGLKRGRGRPPKAVQALLHADPVVAVDQSMAAPLAQAQMNVVSDLTAPGDTRTRGRPRKLTAVAVPAAAAGGIVAAVSGKRRGRPPKYGGVISQPKPKNNYVGTGRSVGRPKKNAPETTGSADGQRVADLKRKLEFFQSKVMQVVGVLKPQFTSESDINAIASIQELEGLAAMEITAPFRDDKPQPQLPMVVENQPPPQQQQPLQFFQSLPLQPPGY